MPVQFILGRAGSGKSRHLLQQLIDLTRADPLGTPLFYLLPRQATFQAERLLTSRLRAFSRIRVVSFDVLGNDILNHCGDVGMPEVTAIGRRMVIGHLLRTHKSKLKFYAGSAHRRGLAAELDSTFGEFDRAGLDVAALENLVNTLQSDDRAAPALHDKLFDLHLLLDAYNKYIGQDKLDPQRRLSLILKRVAGCSLLKDAWVFVDDFYDFTANERRFLCAVAAAVQQTTIALLIDPDSSAAKDPTAFTADLSIFHRTERTYRSLLNALGQAGVVVSPPLFLRGNHRNTAPDLLKIESSIFTEQNQARSAGCESIEAIEAHDARAEVDAVARQIRALLAGGLRYREIGVLVRDLTAYQEMIGASFSEHELPFFADHRRTAAHHPLLQLVRSALQIARHGWPHDAVMTLIKTGLVNLTTDQSDELENYVLQHRIRGRLWQANEPWSFSRDLIISDDSGEPPALSESARVDAARRLLHQNLLPLLEIRKQATVRDLATRIFAMLDAFGVRSTMQSWIQQADAATNIEQREEHVQVWSEFVKLFDHMVDLLGDEMITLVDFIDVLDSGLESFDLAVAPPKVDQILVGQIDRTRPPELKAVFVLGMNEGTFPQPQQERCVMTDRERRALRNRNIDLDPDSERRLLDERFLAYLAFTRASSRLVISRATADSRDREAHASAFWFELFRLMPDIPVQKLSRSKQDAFENIGSPRQLISGLMRWARGGQAATGAGTGAGAGASGDDAENQTWAALYQWLFTSPSAESLKTTRDRAWAALTYSNSARLKSDVAGEMFSSPLKVNARQLETMAECPFRHFARYGLSLRSREEQDVTHVDLSNAYHDILEKLVGDVLRARTDWGKLQPDKVTEMIHLHGAEIGRRLRGELMLSSARNRYLLDRIERNLEQAIASMLEISRRGNFKPWQVAVKFGPGGKLPAYQLHTPQGQEVQLHGQIDRVDLDANQTSVVAFDYKMTTGPLGLDKVFHGLSLQLLTYLLVLQAHGSELAGRQLLPGAAFLLQLLRSPQKVDHPSDAVQPEDPDFMLRVKPRGIIDASILPSLDKQVSGGQFSSVVNAYINADGAPGRINSTDVADAADIDALLLHVERKIGELADRVITGDIAVMPYMMSRKTPCSSCEFRSVCRFEPGINRYRMLQGMRKDDVLAALAGEDGAAADSDQ